MTFIYPTKTRHFRSVEMTNFEVILPALLSRGRGRPACDPLSVLFLFCAIQTGKVANLIRTILRICPETSL